MSRTVRSWPMILLTAFTAPLFGYTLLLFPVALAYNHNRLLAITGVVVSAVIVLGCLVVVIRAPFMRVSVKSGMLRRHGVWASKSIPVDAIEAVSVEETFTADAGFMRLPVVHYRDSAGRPLRLRLWILARKSPFALEPTVAWLEELAGGPRPRY